MKIIKSWLQDYIDLDLENEKLADLLSLSGTAVDSFGEVLDSKVVVAEIREVKKHPNADKLQIATVWNGEEELQIVCGAPNIAPCQKVPLAQIGSVLGEGFVIKKAEIRGIESSGMLCAADELGLGSDHSGIMILDSKWEIGQPLNKYIKSDAVFDIEITPNRGDLLSHIGVARELKALLKKELKKSNYELKINKEAKEIEISVVDSSLCPQYYGLKISGVKPAESPKWLKDRLTSSGFRPINNIVDVTNYILLDLGQPLHAFDATKLKGGINIRPAHFGEGIVTLDGNLRALDEGMIVIADREEAIAIAGVMGGSNSEVDDKTSEIIIEAAEFERRSIRKTAKNLNLSSDASYRFERGIDSGNIENALKKAATLILELAGGEISSKITYVGESFKSEKVKIDYTKINQKLGLNLSVTEIENILTSLGFVVNNDTVTVPSWRHDISIWEDLAEEVARIYGFDNIPKASIEITKPPKKSPYYYKEYLKDVLVKSGFSEIYGYAFMSELDLKVLGTDSSDLLEVANPIQPENKFLRRSLIPGLLKVVAKNPTFDPILIFEIGHGFTKEEETVFLSVATAGKNAKKEIETVIENISILTGVAKSSFEIREHTRDELERFKIKKPLIFTSEINVQLLVDGLIKNNVYPDFVIVTKKIHYRSISKYPSLTRDLAFIVDTMVNPDEIIDEIYSASDQICRVELFDEFSSDKFGTNKKNVAFHLYIQNMNKTMTDSEANQIIKKVIQSITDKFKASLREY